MSYSFIPMTEEELNKSNILNAGIYDFEVVKSNKRISKSGNPMAELMLKVWDKEGKTHNIFDYLVFSNVHMNIKKIKHFCETVGLVNEYKKGQLPEELQGLAGTLLLDIQDERPNSSGGFFPKKNIVVDYSLAKSIESKTDDFIDSDLPF